MAVNWPDVLVPRLITDPELRGMTAAGPRTYGGRDQRVFHDAGFWEYTLGEVMIDTHAKALAWRAMITAARSGEEVLVKVFDPNRPAVDGASTGTLAADASLRDTEIGIEGVDATILPGQFFSLGSDRLHMVVSISDSDAEDIGTVLGFHDGEVWDDGSEWVDGQFVAGAMKIMPPLRKDYDAGTTVNFNNLRLRCVLKDVNDGDATRDLSQVGTPSVTFVETIS